MTPIIASRPIPSTHSLIHLTGNARIRCGGDIATQRFSQKLRARAMLLLSDFLEFCRHFGRKRDCVRNGRAGHAQYSPAWRRSWRRREKLSRGQQKTVLSTFLRFVRGMTKYYFVRNGRIELPPVAWEATVLPLNQFRMFF